MAYDPISQIEASESTDLQGLKKEKKNIKTKNKHAHLYILILLRSLPKPIGVTDITFGGSNLLIDDLTEYFLESFLFFS